MMNDIKYQIRIVRDMGDSYQIEFRSKSEKWAYLKEFHPDIADFILEMAQNELLDSPPIVIEKKSALREKGLIP